MSVDEKLKYYMSWNVEVAILCNHQKAKSKNFDESMAKFKSKIDDVKAGSFACICAEMLVDSGEAETG